MLEANVLEKYHAPTGGRHFLGPVHVGCFFNKGSASVLTIPERYWSLLKMSAYLFEL